jgi:hypothetical protein
MTRKTTIVSCIEAGPLEAQVLMLIESLRCFGGPSANADVVIVKPRRGPAISSHTRRELVRLQTDLIEEKFNVEFDWWNNANKSAVMSALETRVSSPNITWMDGDMIVLQPIENLAPLPDSNFVARAGEGYLGSDGDDENGPYWRKLCELTGLNFDTFPTINSFPERRPIRAYWQSGIYSYATATGLGRVHYEMIRKLLSNNIGSKSAGVYHQDQVSLALACQKLGLIHSEYPARMNFNLNPLAKENADLLPLGEVVVLHYHNSFYRNDVDWALSYIGGLAPDRRELIRKYVPLTANATLMARVHKKLLGAIRQKQVRRFQEQAILY